eukprot:Nk52_evm4s311 gene=Nk52_evmTU4s311
MGGASSSEESQSSSSYEDVIRRVYKEISDEGGTICEGKLKMVFSEEVFGSEELNKFWGIPCSDGLGRLKKLVDLYLNEPYVYPKVLTHVKEEEPAEVNGVEIPVDTSRPNPNGIEFDNLYLDMNGIIHPCTHPEDRPPPESEEEMFVLIFEYIDRLIRIVRPRKLLYMAIDGVAPRAKMNQQRARRFGARREAEEKRRQLEEVQETMRKDLAGTNVEFENNNGLSFDRNCITPGTPFMHHLAKSLSYYIALRMTNDPAWRHLKVILSDSNVPGEGEHKVQDFIRRQRAHVDHDVNTKHVLCGNDADLIMLGLATHEPNFYILREEFIMNTTRPCDICGKMGHRKEECTGGLKSEEIGTNIETPKPKVKKKNFDMVHISVLFEYLSYELKPERGLPFPFDIERAIDDWVFLCYFVGNDFLPHLPSLEIREGAIDTLVTLYKKMLPMLGGFLTENGDVSLKRCEWLMGELGDVEDGVFKKRRNDEVRRRDRRKRQKEQKKARDMGERTHKGFSFDGLSGADAVRAAREYRRNQVQPPPQKLKEANENAAKSLKRLLDGAESELPKKKTKTEAEKAETKKEGAENDVDKSVADFDDDNSPFDNTASEPEDEDDRMDREQDEKDEVKLYENGWKERYYSTKFNVSEDDTEFRAQVAASYAEGLCWVFAYYYKGCVDWDWYYPYHYAPFASDFVDLEERVKDFNTKSKPFYPLEQLMAVQPSSSGSFMPKTWHQLMVDEDSPIKHFYPEEFTVDLNGKRFLWQGVALLPWIEQDLLLDTLKLVYPDLEEDEMERNDLGHDTLFVSKHDKSLLPLLKVYEGLHPWKERTANNGRLVRSESQINLCEDRKLVLDASYTNGLNGEVLPSFEPVMPGKVILSSLKNEGYDDLMDTAALSVQFVNPQFPEGFVFPQKRFSKARVPPPIVSYDDFMASSNSHRKNNREVYNNNNDGFHGDRNNRQGGGRGPGFGNNSRNFNNRNNNQYGNDYRPQRGGYQGQQGYGHQPQQAYGGHGGQSAYGAYQGRGGQSAYSAYQGQGGYVDRYNQRPDEFNYSYDSGYSNNSQKGGRGGYAPQHYQQPQQPRYESNPQNIGWNRNAARNPTRPAYNQPPNRGNSNYNRSGGPPQRGHGAHHRGRQGPPAGPSRGSMRPGGHGGSRGGGNSGGYGR